MSPNDDGCAPVAFQIGLLHLTFPDDIYGKNKPKEEQIMDESAKGYLL